MIQLPPSMLSSLPYDKVTLCYQKREVLKEEDVLFNYAREAPEGCTLHFMDRNTWLHSSAQLNVFKHF